MRAALQRAWLHRGPLAYLLLPLGWLYGALVALRRALYAAGVLRSERMPVPVVIAGNVVAGGAGKTPVVIALIGHLQSRGLQPGVVSRGYGRRTTGCLEVNGASLAADTGDEPLLVKRRTGAPVFVGERRAEAARELLRRYPHTQVIVSDDGLQHLALQRDIEVCVFDEHGAGNGWLLPAGPLREPWPRQVDLVLRPGDMQRSLSAAAVRADGTRMPWQELRGRPLHAVAGIANPERFFDMLRAQGLLLAGCSALPDHHDFADAAPWQGRELVCTEKDAVKLWRLRPDAWAAPLEVRIDDAWWRQFDAKLSSVHGPQTA
ncbi:MAG: tetraacyldisaccharide 4'-kinase [Burkholderiales bacterium]|nr:tetraacyldisaccharide 4'-kinase [Burkholderiales bacterium]